MPHPLSLPLPLLLMILTLTLTLTLGRAPGPEDEGEAEGVVLQADVPGVERIVAEAVTAKQIANPSTAAGALRVFFHDCFAGGCDASLLISPDSGPGSSAAAERDAEINRSLPGDAFDAVARAKAALEQACPGPCRAPTCSPSPRATSSPCSAGPSTPSASAAATPPSPPPPPPPTSPRPPPHQHDRPPTHRPLRLQESALNLLLLRFFTLERRCHSILYLDSTFDRGFTVQEMVALAGAHTVGFSHCKEFAGRIYNFENRGPNAFDPALNPRFAQGLQRACASYLKDPTISTFNDVMTPGKFDNLYFQNLPRGLGLLASDAALFVDTRTRPFVERYAANQTAFFEDFALAMEKLSAYGVKTGRDGEVRRRCDAFNDHP
uniref:Peroxidase n=1 Tax=Ananas comosus var. bracteatus TaxID=296719 RepID=A0A6V7P393_ANACO|nr:unnamed protein product [Ananas comosus var. bracteatus]